MKQRITLQCVKIILAKFFGSILKACLSKKNPKGNRFCPEFRKKRKVMQKRKCSRQFYGLLTVAENLFKFFSPVCRTVIKGLTSQKSFLWKVLPLTLAIFSSSLKNLTTLLLYFHQVWRTKWLHNFTDGNIY